MKVYNLKVTDSELPALEIMCNERDWSKDEMIDVTFEDAALLLQANGIFIIYCFEREAYFFTNKMEA